MKLSKILGSACLALTMMVTAKADTVANFNTTVTSSDPTQLGRLSRNGVAQDWTGSEAYPGIINTTTTYSYRTLTLASSLFNGGQYVQIEAYEPAGTVNLFLSAYAGTYDAAHWLGDGGTSGDVFFQVVLPLNTNLLLVANTTAAGTSQFGTVLNVNVENFSDTDYDSPVPVAATPEPGSILLVGTGLLSAVAGVRRRLMAA